MDETDVVLSLLLLQNSRTPYRELADRLSLSVPSVHKRIMAMREAGIIRAFTARISLFAVRGIHTLMFGSSDSSSPDEVPNLLRKNDSIYWIAVASGNYLIVGAYLHDLSEVEECVDFVKKATRMPNPTVGIDSSPLGGTGSTPELARMTRLDFEIIESLHKDSRKSISDVAGELGVSAKTARRHLQMMTDGGLIDLSMEWYPDASNDIMTFLHLYLNEDADKSKAIHALTNKYSPRALFFWSFSNLPNHLSSMVWSNSMKELKETRTRLQGEPFIKSVVSNVLYTGYIFETWRDKLPTERIKLLKPKS